MYWKASATDWIRSSWRMTVMVLLPGKCGGLRDSTSAVAGGIMCSGQGAVGLGRKSYVRHIFLNEGQSADRHPRRFRPATGRCQSQNKQGDHKMSSEQQARVYQPSAEAVSRARVSGMDAYEALCAEADRDYENFWARHARELLEWQTPFTQVLDESEAPFFKWFADGTLNVSYNCLDRNVKRGDGNKTAIIFESDDGKVARVSYADLLVRVCRFANALRDMGVKKGDRVIIYLP